MEFQKRMLTKQTEAAATSTAASERGFTLLETIVAMLILMIGLVGVAGVTAYALQASNRSRNVTSAKMLVVAMLEQVENLRNTKQLTYQQINTVGSAADASAEYNFTGFANPGTLAAPLFVSITTEPGADGIYGTADEAALAVRPGYAGYGRNIRIVNAASGNMKTITVTVRYPGANGTLQLLTGTSYLNNDARGNYIR